MTVGVVIPTIPPRANLLGRALASVVNQTRLPEVITVRSDQYRDGPAAVRNQAVLETDTEWIAFLDDDDELLPRHIEVLMDHNADLVYPWFEYVGGSDPLAVEVDGLLRSPFGVTFGPEQREFIVNRANFIPVTYIVRRSVFLDLGGFPHPGTKAWPMKDCEDWGFLTKLVHSNATVVHVPERTWRWHHQHSGNTSGRPDRW